MRAAATSQVDAVLLLIFTFGKLVFAVNPLLLNLGNEKLIPKSLSALIDVLLYILLYANFFGLEELRSISKISIIFSFLI